MEFDKSKVYTLLTADEVKVGSKGYFAHSLGVLKTAVLREDNEMFGEIIKILDDTAPCRFGIKDDEFIYDEYALFYLVEEPKENGFRPYKNVDEMIDHFCSHFKQVPQAHQMPLIWIKSKTTGFRHLITDYSNNSERCRCIWIGSFSLNFKDLSDKYIYLDDTPCGVTEE